VLFVAVFIVTFSTLFTQVDNILMFMFMFMFISASLYASSAGVVLLGGLYWRRSTTPAAWVAMIVGAVLSVAGLVCRSVYPDWLPDGSIIAFWVSIICVGLYLAVSYLGTDPQFDLDEMLNRERPGADGGTSASARNRWWHFGREVPRSDRVLIASIISVFVVFAIVFVGVCVYNVRHNVATSGWVGFWHGYLYAMFAFGSAFLVWITVGGLRDLSRLFSRLKAQVANEHDNGSVDGHRAARRRFRAAPDLAPDPHAARPWFHRQSGRSRWRGRGTCRGPAPSMNPPVMVKAVRTGARAAGKGVSTGGEAGPRQHAEQLRPGSSTC